MERQRARRREQRAEELKARDQRLTDRDLARRDQGDVDWFDTLSERYKTHKYAFHYYGSGVRLDWLRRQRYEIVEQCHCLCKDADGGHFHVHALLFSHVSGGTLRQRYHRHSGGGQLNNTERGHTTIKNIKCLDHLANIIHYLACPSGQRFKTHKGKPHHHYNHNLPPYLSHPSYPTACATTKRRITRELKERGHHHPPNCPCLARKREFSQRCADGRNKRNKSHAILDAHQRRFNPTPAALDRIARLEAALGKTPVAPVAAPLKPKRKMYDDDEP
jgi:hypothetical protein